MDSSNLAASTDVNNGSHTPDLDLDADMDVVGSSHNQDHGPIDHSVYVQTAGNLDHDSNGDLWRLPIQYTRTSNKKVLSKCEHPQYQSLCNKIAKYWLSEDAKTWIPSHFLKTTPYSYTLLHQLGILSKQTKGQRLLALNKLQSMCDQRQSTTEARQSVLHQTARGVKGVEGEYIERIDGVMCRDLSEVVAHFRHLKKDKKLHNSHMRQHKDQQQAAIKQHSRREAKKKAQIKIQREMLRDKSSVELVGIEWACDGASDQADYKEAGGKPGKKSGKLIGMRRTRLPGQIRTKEELSSSFRVDDLDREWNSESDRDVDDDDISLELANPDAEPKVVDRQTRRKQLKSIQNKRQRAALQEANKLEMSTDIADADELEPAPSKTQAQIREDNRRMAEEVLANVTARSIQLPSERIDLSLLGKLEKPTDQKQISGMLDGLNAIAMDIEKKEAS